MADTTMPLSELLQEQDGGDFLRALAEAVLQLRMEVDVEGVIGAVLNNIHTIGARVSD